MCAGAISNARIRRLYFGAYSSKRNDIVAFKLNKYFSSDECNHSPEIYGGILEIECSKLIKSYFKTKR
jgi:tRNA(Arg) A34 adenosine deaminase TadA